jgi:hypothetical protein
MNEKEIVQPTEMSASDRAGLAMSNLSSFCWDGSYPFDTSQSLQEPSFYEIYACIISNRTIESISINSRLFNDEKTGATLLG